MPLKKLGAAGKTSKGPTKGGSKSKKSKLMGKKGKAFGSSKNKGKSAVTSDKQYAKAYKRMYGN